jgi:hypothetical protein
MFDANGFTFFFDNLPSHVFGPDDYLVQGQHRLPVLHVKCFTWMANLVLIGQSIPPISASVARSLCKWLSSCSSTRGLNIDNSIMRELLSIDGNRLIRIVFTWNGVKAIHMKTIKCLFMLATRCLNVGPNGGRPISASKTPKSLFVESKGRCKILFRSQFLT